MYSTHPAAARAAAPARNLRAAAAAALAGPGVHRRQRRRRRRLRVASWAPACGGLECLRIATKLRGAPRSQPGRPGRGAHSIAAWLVYKTVLLAHQLQHASTVIAAVRGAKLSGGSARAHLGRSQWPHCLSTGRSNVIRVGGSNGRAISFEGEQHFRRPVHGRPGKAPPHAWCCYLGSWHPAGAASQQGARHGFGLAVAAAARCSRMGGLPVPKVSWLGGADAWQPTRWPSSVPLTPHCCGSASVLLHLPLAPVGWMQRCWRTTWKRPSPPLGLFRQPAAARCRRSAPAPNVCCRVVFCAAALPLEDVL